MMLLFTRFIGIIACAPFFFALVAHADEKQVLSVTPPLFQLSILPGDIWQSSIKVVNGNTYPLTVYAELNNFEAVGEAGQGRFIPISSNGDKTTLAEWITVPSRTYTIEPEQTQEIQFFVEVPKDASPGGHYAAILISTEPPQSDGELAVRTSQAVTSLLFMRVEGDVREDATVREFRAIDSFLDVPDVAFSLRFENKGNVHLQPRGSIIITNMWGTERGTIPINYQTHYGNVLPKSIRDFSFAWKSDFSITDVGRYKAEVTLAYGDDGVKSTSAVAYFWVIPIKWTLITLSVLGLFITLIVVMVRAYVRRMLELAGVEMPRKTVEDTMSDTTKETSTHHQYRATAPLRDGVLDLRTRLTTTSESHNIFSTILRFVLSYKWFFVSIVALIMMFVVLSLYIGQVTEDKSYEVTVDQGDSATVLKDSDVDALMQE